MSAIYKKLEEVCEILDSRRVPITAKNRKTGIYPYYGANGLQDYVAEYIFDDELVLLAEDGGNFGSKERPIAYRVSGKCWVNNHAHVLKAKPLVNADYLCYALMFYDTEGLVNGATRQKLTQTAMRQMMIPYRNMTEQLQIADEINQVIRLIDKRKEELSLLDQLVKSRFIEMFGSGRYPTVIASEVCDFITKGTTPPTGEITEKYEIGMIPYLKVYNLSFTGELLFDNMPQYISADTHNKQLARSKVLPNDVLMNIVGPPLGKFSLVTDEFSEWNINQAIAIFRAKDRVLPRYLMAALMQPNVLRPFLEQAVGIRQLNLSLEQCRNLEFPLPPIEEQRAFVELSEQTDKSKYLFYCLEYIRNNFNAMLEFYMGG
ncbi:restriction endonuclease subunit S [Enterocloster sp.]|jgi:type I restriction enzyme S subunit|uniref:restriction endonuclease subunit S n=2 Tax=Clostridia TaxID=186801 RepID=UPI003AB6E858